MAEKDFSEMRKTRAVYWREFKKRALDYLSNPFFWDKLFIKK